MTQKPLHLYRQLRSLIFYCSALMYTVCGAARCLLDCLAITDGPLVAGSSCCVLEYSAAGAETVLHHG